MTQQAFKNTAILMLCYTIIHMGSMKMLGPEKSMQEHPYVFGQVLAAALFTMIYLEREAKEHNQK